MPLDNIFYFILFFVSMLIETEIEFVWGWIKKSTKFCVSVFLCFLLAGNICFANKHNRLNWNVLTQVRLLNIHLTKYTDMWYGVITIILFIKYDGKNDNDYFLAKQGIYKW